MALPKPPKDIYDLTEIAEEWDWSVRDILEYARHGKLNLCIRIIHTRVVWFTIYSDERHHSVQDFFEGVCGVSDVFGDVLDCMGKQVTHYDDQYEYLNGIYPILQEQLNVEHRYTFDPIETFLSIDFLCQEFGIKDDRYWCIGYQINHIENKPKLLITHKEKTRFEYDCQNHTVVDFQKDFTARPREEEKPLIHLKEIAKHCNVHIDTIKNWRKEYKDFPVSPPGQGTVTAIPSELNAWLVNKKKK